MNPCIEYQPVETQENWLPPQRRGPEALGVLAPLPPLLQLRCIRWAALGWVWAGSPSDVLLLSSFFSFFFFFLGAEETFSFYSDQTSYLSICLEEHSRLHVEHFSQEELKKKVLTLLTFSALLVICCLLGS